MSPQQKAHEACVDVAVLIRHIMGDDARDFEAWTLEVTNSSITNSLIAFEFIDIQLRGRGA